MFDTFAHFLCQLILLSEKKRFHHDVIQFLFNISAGERNRFKGESTEADAEMYAKARDYHRSNVFFPPPSLSPLLRQNIAIKTDPSK